MIMDETMRIFHLLRIIVDKKSPDLSSERCICPKTSKTWGEGRGIRHDIQAKLQKRYRLGLADKAGDCRFTYSDVHIHNFAMNKLKSWNQAVITI